MEALIRQGGQCSTSGRSCSFRVTRMANFSQQRDIDPERKPRTENLRLPAAYNKLTAHRKRRFRHQRASAGLNGAGTTSPRGITDLDSGYLQLATQLAGSSEGLTAPHPNAGCLLVDSSGQVIAEAHQRAQGSEAVEIQTARLAGPAAAGSTAYLNLETGDCHGDDTAIRTLISCGVKRIVVGLKYPLQHSRGRAVKKYRQAGLSVEVLGESPYIGDPTLEEQVHKSCVDMNEALIHRAATGKPLGILKYAMTLDGKIATSSGHSAWVTSPTSRARVFETRAKSDAIIVGGQTVRRDNPRLTTRRESGHTPARIVMSRTLELPPDANLWDISIAPTIIMTQRGARCEFQAHLLSRGVEVVQFDFLTPEAVASYCAERGFLQCLWECGGTLAAPAIAGGSIHKCLAFVAPKMIGGVRAPSPVGELGNVEMTQATDLVETSWEAIGPDMLMTGYLPSSGGPAALDAALHLQSTGVKERSNSAGPTATGQGVHMQTIRPRQHGQAVEFYKTWDRYGALSNFSPHQIRMPEEVPANGAAPSVPSPQRCWPTLEHYYQAQKFSGRSSHEARELMEDILAAASPEEAARLGRAAQRAQPHLVRPDWETAKLFIMLAALQAKFTQNEGPRATLLSTAPHQLVEASPQDFFWGRGVDNTGSNHLGILLMRVRDEILRLPDHTVAPAVESIRPHGLASTVQQL